jgi:septal ring factor EnvC (AmiA/AmiB activator)
MSMAAFAFEVLIAFLLLGAAVMCWRVDRRLKALREGQDGLRQTISDLNDAVDRARASLGQLDRAAKESGAGLEQKVKDAQRLCDELRILNDGAEARAERLARARRPDPAPAPRREAAPERRLDPLNSLR